MAEPPEMTSAQLAAEKNRQMLEDDAFEKSRRKSKDDAMRVYKSELFAPKALDLHLHGTSRATLRVLCQQTILDASQQIKRKYSYSAISSALSSMNGRDAKDSVSALRNLQKERMIATRLGFPDKAYELDREIELMRDKAKTQRDKEEAQILALRMRSLKVSHTRKQHRLEYLIAQETAELEEKIKSEEHKLIKRQELEFVRILEGASRRAIGKTKKCNCVAAYLCRHNKTASYNTRRPSKTVVQYRRNSRRLRQAGRTEEGQAWEEKAKEIDDREQEEWRKKISNSIVASPWGANEAIIDTMTERHKKELEILRQTHEVKHKFHDKNLEMKRRNMMNTMLAEQRKVRMHCRKQASQRQHNLSDHIEEEEEMFKKLQYNEDGMLILSLRNEEESEYDNGGGFDYEQQMRLIQEKRRADGIEDEFDIDDYGDDIMGGGMTYDFDEEITPKRAASAPSSPRALPSAQEQMKRMSDSNPNTPREPSHVLSQSLPGRPASTFDQPAQAVQSRVVSHAPPEKAPPSTPSFRSGRNINFVETEMNNTGQVSSNALTSPSLHHEQFPPTPMAARFGSSFNSGASANSGGTGDSTGAVGARIEGGRGIKVHSPPPSTGDNYSLESNNSAENLVSAAAPVVTAVAAVVAAEQKSSRAVVNKQGGARSMKAVNSLQPDWIFEERDNEKPSFQPGSLKDEDYADKERSLGVGLYSSYGVLLAEDGTLKSVQKPSPSADIVDKISKKKATKPKQPNIDPDLLPKDPEEEALYADIKVEVFSYEDAAIFQPASPFEQPSRSAMKTPTSRNNGGGHGGKGGVKFSETSQAAEFESNNVDGLLCLPVSPGTPGSTVSGASSLASNSTTANSPANWSVAFARLGFLNNYSETLYHILTNIDLYETAEIYAASIERPDMNLNAVLSILKGYVDYMKDGKNDQELSSGFLELFGIDTYEIPGGVKAALAEKKDDIEFLRNTTSEVFVPEFIMSKDFEMYQASLIDNASDIHSVDSPIWPQKLFSVLDHYCYPVLLARSAVDAALPEIIYHNDAFDKVFGQQEKVYLKNMIDSDNSDDGAVRTLFGAINDQKDVMITIVCNTKNGGKMITLVCTKNFASIDRSKVYSLFLLFDMKQEDSAEQLKKINCVLQALSA